MMKNINNYKVYLPFDEPIGTTKAYDYSKSRQDFTLTGTCSIVPGKVGRALKKTDGFSSADVCGDMINFESDTTIMAYIKANEDENGNISPVEITCAVEGGGEIMFYPQIQKGFWKHVAIVIENVFGTYYYKMYEDGALSDTQEGSYLADIIINDSATAADGTVIIDEFKAFQYALSATEIQDEMNTISDVIYKLDGVDLRDYGVFVSKSDGILSRPKSKEKLSKSWDEYHGKVVDRAKKYYEERSISLSCFIKAEDKVSFEMRVNEFLRLFDAAGTRRLMIEAHPTKPLVYEVDADDSIEISKEWNETKMAGTFTLKLTEDAPVKRVLRHWRVSDATKTCSITLTSTKLVDVYWGDGAVTYDISGTAQTVSHNYAADGIYYPVVVGCIDEITSFTTNAVIVWNKL